MVWTYSIEQHEDDLHFWSSIYTAWQKNKLASVSTVRVTWVYLWCVNGIFVDEQRELSQVWLWKFCFLLDLNVCSWYLRLHFLQQVPSTCTGSESSEQFAGGQKILRHSTTPFCKKMTFFFSFFYKNLQTSKAKIKPSLWTYSFCLRHCQKKPHTEHVSHFPLCFNLHLNKHSWKITPSLEQNTLFTQPNPTTVNI